MFIFMFSFVCFSNKHKSKTRAGRTDTNALSRLFLDKTRRNISKCFGLIFSTLFVDRYSRSFWSSWYNFSFLLNVILVRFHKRFIISFSFTIKIYKIINDFVLKLGSKFVSVPYEKERERERDKRGIVNGILFVRPKKEHFFICSVSFANVVLLFLHFLL